MGCAWKMAGLTHQFGVGNFYMRAGTCLKTRAQGPYCVQGKLLCRRTQFLAHTNRSLNAHEGPWAGWSGPRDAEQCTPCGCANRKHRALPRHFGSNTKYYPICRVAHRGRRPLARRRPRRRRTTTESRATSGNETRGGVLLLGMPTEGVVLSSVNCSSSNTASRSHQVRFLSVPAVLIALSADIKDPDTIFQSSIWKTDS